MPKPPGLPKGHVPRYAPPADNSRLFGSHTVEAKRLRRAADEADWSGNPDTAKRLYARAEYHRERPLCRTSCRCSRTRTMKTITKKSAETGPYTRISRGYWFVDGEAMPWRKAKRIVRASLAKR